MAQQSYVSDSSRRAMYPSYQRSAEGKVVAGVAAGLSAHLGVEVFYVRLAFMLLSLVSGIGLVLYAALIFFSLGQRTPVDTKNVPRPVYAAMVVVAVLCVITIDLPFGGGGPSIGIPLGGIGAGAILTWAAFDRGITTKRGSALVLVGLLFVVSGLVLVAYNARYEGFTGAVAAMLVTLVGITAVGAPFVMRLLIRLREQEIANERADIASHLHDSVLQTLALIQKRADDPVEVTRLARSQERELRRWLFNPDEATNQTVFAAVGKAAGEVEDLLGVHIAPVTVGEDLPLSDAALATVMAAREAMVNAGKHAGVDKIDVYAENFAGELSIFVRDRGVGFDVEAIPEDRHGVRDSIEGRMQRIKGGSARIKSTPGEGTEVTVTLAYS